MLSLAAVLSLCVAACFGVRPAAAQPVDPTAILPTPLADDEFFAWPTGVENYAPGEIVRSRVVTLTAFPGTLTAHRAYQIMVRSNDAKERPVPVTATLVVPTTPWTPGSPRPVVVYNRAIDSLGARCAPSYMLVHNPIDIDLPPVLPLFLARGYAVLLPDHEGPRMAYAAGRMAAHAVLDSIRGMKNLSSVDLADSPVAMTGYSGGAIATGWAAQMQPTYAPDVPLAGAAAGGTPADFALLRSTLNGQIGSGLYLSAILGITREYPEMLDLANPLGAWMATSLFKDQCSTVLIPAGLLMLPVQLLTDSPDPFDTPIARAVVADNKMGSLTPEAPVYLYHGSSRVFLGDEWVPERGALDLQREWCSRGANVTYAPEFGGHLTAAVLGVPGMMDWLDQRLAGVPAPQGCPSH